jgi:large subunit ribosomal protein L18
VAKSVRKLSRNLHREAVHERVRRRVVGTPERPRLCVYRSLGHIYAQVIDDRSGRTLVSASSLDKKLRENTSADKKKSGGNIAAAKIVGKNVAERALGAGIQQVVFDRGGYMYHGRVEALANAAREAGLKF